MSGVPIHTQSPINASKATDITPHTAAPPTNPHAGPGAPPAKAEQSTTSASESGNSSYPAARPGAAPGPAPTSSAARGQDPVVRAPIPSATRTQAAPEPQQNQPPAPQPGAFPVPNQVPATTTSAAPSSNLPPPPKPGQAATARAQGVPPSTVEPTGTPQAFSSAKVSEGAPSASPVSFQQSQTSRTSTTTTQPPSSYQPAVSLPGPGPTPTTGGPQSLEHPPGYVQNPYAAELTPAQRLAAEQDRSNLSRLGDYAGGASSGAGVGGGPLHSAGGGLADTGEGEGEGIWDTAKKWAKTAGEKVSEAEQEVWKRINKE
ncbi:MAG: hypothetical protein M4579_005040 [Chaenotheca gracillima]|nr:MAG: hypothetical protein M4579_005040 [Chaenotheca gracillima]